MKKIFSIVCIVIFSCCSCSLTQKEFEEMAEIWNQAKTEKLAKEQAEKEAKKNDAQKTPDAIPVSKNTTSQHSKDGRCKKAGCKIEGDLNKDGLCSGCAKATVEDPFR